MNTIQGRQKRWIYWLAIVVAVPSLYAAAFWNDLRKIDSFCNSIETNTKLNQLSPLESKIGVDLIGPVEHPKGSGIYVAIAASGFTVGEYKCTVNANHEHVTSKNLGYQ